MSEFKTIHTLLSFLPPSSSLSSAQKNTILTMLDAGQSTCSISATTGVHPSTISRLLLRHGRDVLPTRGKSTTGNVVLRFWVLVLGRSRDERLLSFWWRVASPGTLVSYEESFEWKGGKGLVNWWTITWILCTVREQKKPSLGLQATQQAWLYTGKDTAPQSVVTTAQSVVIRVRSTAQSAATLPGLKLWAA